MAIDPETLRAARAQWHWRGQARPSFAHEPADGQQSVWDFPRPPALRRVAERLTVKRGDVVIAQTDAGWCACETAHPPTYYFPPDDVDHAHLKKVGGGSFCEWKGEARYWDVLAGDPLPRAAWCYPAPYEAWAPITGYLAFMPTALACFVGDERARPQPGGFYGGWITSRYAGPFKGEPGING